MTGYLSAINLVHYTPKSHAIPKHQRRQDEEEVDHRTVDTEQ